MDTPFKHQGRSKAGIDCVGLQVFAGLAAGAVINDFTDYSLYPNPEQLLKNFEEQMDPIPAHEAGPGDVPIFWIKERKVPKHVGILTTGPYFIHTHSSIRVGKQKGKVCEVTLDDRWAPRVHSFWRYRWQQSH